MPAAPNEQITNLTRQGAYLDALPLAEEASAKRPGDAGLLVALGVLLRELGHYSRAEAPLLQALSLRAAEVGKEHANYAQALHELGRLYEETGQYASAEKLFRAGLAAREKSLGPEHADAAESLHDLAALLEKLGRYREGRELGEKALSIRQRALGGDHADTARSLTMRAWGASRLRHGDAAAVEAGASPGPARRGRAPGEGRIGGA
jgi:tetratricopeptide (TPR) repeat protein